MYSPHCQKQHGDREEAFYHSCPFHHWGSALELGGVCTGAWRGLHWSFGTSRGSRGSSPLPEGSSLPGNLHCAVAEGVFTVTSRQGDLTSRRGHHCEVFPWSSLTIASQNLRVQSLRPELFKVTDWTCAHGKLLACHN